MSQPNQIQTKVGLVELEAGRRERGLMDNLRTGQRVQRRILLGKLPSQLRAVELRRGSFRRMFEAAIVERKGEVSLLDAAAVSEASLWVSSVALIDWCLRHKLGELSCRDMAGMARQQAAALGHVRRVMGEVLADKRAASSLLEELEAQYRQSQSSNPSDALQGKPEPQGDESE